MGCLTPEEKVSGAYELKNADDTETLAVFLENGVGFHYHKKGSPTSWKIRDKEIHAVGDKGETVVFRINPDGSLSSIASIDKDGKRKEILKEDRQTLKKIK